MKTLFFVLCLFLSVEGALSQETGKLYTTLSDLLNETSSSTLNVIKEKRNKKTTVHVRRRRLQNIQWGQRTR